MGSISVSAFARKMNPKARARATEPAIGRARAPAVRRVPKKDTFASIIDFHINDLIVDCKPIRPSKGPYLRRLRARFGDLSLVTRARERVLRLGRDRAKAGAGPATITDDSSRIGEVGPCSPIPRCGSRGG